MAIILEGERSRRWTIGEPGELNILRTVHRVRWEPESGEDEGDYPGDEALIYATGMPQPRERYMDGSEWMQHLVCRTTEAARLPTPAIFTVEVTSTWTTLAPAFGDFCRVTKSAGGRSFNLYRTGWDWEDVPEDGNPTWPATTDMGGDKVDLYGRPRQIIVPQQTITIEVLWDRTRNDPPEPPFAWLDQYVNSRNEEEFLGAGIGTLLYRGYSESRPTNEIGIVQHTFVYDAFQHLEQVVVNNSAGQPFLGSGITLISILQKQVSKVAWFQPYTSLTDFSADGTILTTGQLAELATPVPEWPA